MQRDSLELSDQLVILQLCPLLLRKDWADWRRWPSREATQCFCVLPLKCIDVFPFLCFLFLVSYRMTGFCEVLQHFFLQFDSKTIRFAIVSSAPLLFRSREFMNILQIAKFTFKSSIGSPDCLPLKFLTMEKTASIPWDVFGDISR